MDLATLYFCVRTTRKQCEWYTVDLISRKHEIHEKMNSIQTPLLCGCTSLNSSIYVIGGEIHEHRRTKIINSVKIFDTNTSEWKNGAFMNVERSCPIVIPASNKIYVFGGACSTSKEAWPANKPWAEIYDISKNVWNPIRSTPTEVIKPGLSYGKVACNPGSIFTFWGEDLFCVYDATHDAWYVHYLNRFIPGNFLTCISTRVAVASDVVYWYYGKDLFSYNLKKRCYPRERTTRLLLTSQPRLHICNEQSTLPFLIPVNDKFFCLVWFELSNGTIFRQLRCYWVMFPIHDESTMPRRLLSLEPCGFFQVYHGIDILHCFAMQQLHSQDHDEKKVCAPYVAADPLAFLKDFSQTMYTGNYLSYFCSISNGDGRFPINIPLVSEDNSDYESSRSRSLSSSPSPRRESSRRRNRSPSSSPSPRRESSRSRSPSSSRSPSPRRVIPAAESDSNPDIISPASRRRKISTLI